MIYSFIFQIQNGYIFAFLNYGKFTFIIHSIYYSIDRITIQSTTYYMKCCE